MWSHTRCFSSTTTDCGHKSWHNPSSARSTVAADTSDVRCNIYIHVPPEIGMPEYRGTRCIVFPGNIYLRIQLRRVRRQRAASTRVGVFSWIMRNLARARWNAMKRGERHFSVNDSYCSNHGRHPPENKWRVTPTHKCCPKCN